MMLRFCCSVTNLLSTPLSADPLTNSSTYFLLINPLTNQPTDLLLMIIMKGFDSVRIRQGLAQWKKFAGIKTPHPSLLATDITSAESSSSSSSSSGGAGDEGNSSNSNTKDPNSVEALSQKASRLKALLARSQAITARVREENDGLRQQMVRSENKFLRQVREFTQSLSQPV
jgi:hypothetical protein